MEECEGGREVSSLVRTKEGRSMAVLVRRFVRDLELKAELRRQLRESRDKGTIKTRPRRKIKAEHVLLSPPRPLSPYNPSTRSSTRTSRDYMLPCPFCHLPNSNRTRKENVPTNSPQTIDPAPLPDRSLPKPSDELQSDQGSLPDGVDSFGVYKQDERGEFRSKSLLDERFVRHPETWEAGGKGRERKVSDLRAWDEGWDDHRREGGGLMAREWCRER